MAERRYTTIFAFAVLTAGVATFGIYRVLQTSKARNKLQTQPVVVALQDISEGLAIDRVAVAIAQWPVGTVPAGAFTSIDSVAGRVTRVDVFKGEVLVPGRLAPSGTEPGLAVKITPGKRALALRIDDVASLNGLIQPNSRVDVLVTLPDAQKGNQQVAKTFMSNMRVLSVGTISQVSRDNRPIQAPVATLEVTPDEAERLAIAQRVGIIQLSLRGYGDPDSIKTEGAKTSDVLAQLRAAPPAKQVAATTRASERRTSSSSSARGGIGGKLASGFNSAGDNLTQSPPAPVVMPQAEPLPPKPKKPDTATVQVYKGDKLDTRKFVKSDTAKPDAGKPPTP
jgi:pilus assembly protein CpaB